MTDPHATFLNRCRLALSRFRRSVRAMLRDSGLSRAGCAARPVNSPDPDPEWEATMLEWEPEVRQIGVVAAALGVSFMALDIRPWSEDACSFDRDEWRGTCAEAWLRELKALGHQVRADPSDAGRLILMGVPVEATAIRDAVWKHKSIAAGLCEVMA